MVDRLQLRKDLSWRAVGDEIVVLDLRTTSYFAVQGAAVTMWALLVDGTDEDGLVSAVLAEYDVDADQARADVAAFVSDLRTRDLLR
jgi:type IV secretory pathway TrbF-like protein